MKIRAQIGKVLNLDKCIGCHTCSVTCKNVWTSREGMEYAWFNNVETKPGIGYPKDWENQKRWNGGWVRDAGGSIRPKMGGKWRSEEHTSELQSLMRISYAVFCLKKKTQNTTKEAKYQKSTVQNNRRSRS